MEKLKLVFFIESPKPYGGAHSLYLDLASYISDHYSNYECYYINHYYPVVERDYANSKLNICDVTKCDYYQFENAIFFVSINYLPYLLTKITFLKNAKICVYFFHPEVFTWYSDQFLSEKPYLYDILELLHQKEGYCFMDKSNFLAVSKLTPNLCFSEKYVPVVIHNKQISLYKKTGIIQIN